MTTWQNGGNIKTFSFFHPSIWQSLKLIRIMDLEILIFFLFLILPLETNNLPPETHILFVKKNFQNFSNLILLILKKSHYPIIFSLKVMKYQSWHAHFVHPPSTPLPPGWIGLRTNISWCWKILHNFIAVPRVSTPWFFIHFIKVLTDSTKWLYSVVALQIRKISKFKHQTIFVWHSNNTKIKVISRVI